MCKFYEILTPLNGHCNGKFDMRCNYCVALKRCLYAVQTFISLSYNLVMVPERSNNNLFFNFKSVNGSVLRSQRTIKNLYDSVVVNSANNAPKLHNHLMPKTKLLVKKKETFGTIRKFLPF